MVRNMIDPQELFKKEKKLRFFSIWYLAVLIVAYLAFLQVNLRPFEVKEIDEVATVLYEVSIYLIFPIFFAFIIIYLFRIKLSEKNGDLLIQVVLLKCREHLENMKDALHEHNSFTFMDEKFLLGFDLGKIEKRLPFKYRLYYKILFSDINQISKQYKNVLICNIVDVSENSLCDYTLCKDEAGRKYYFGRNTSVSIEKINVENEILQKIRIKLKRAKVNQKGIKETLVVNNGAKWLIKDADISMFEKTVTEDVDCLLGEMEYFQSHMPPEYKKEYFDALEVAFTVFSTVFAVILEVAKLFPTQL